MVDLNVALLSCSSQKKQKKRSELIKYYPNGNKDDAEKLFDSLPLTDVRPISSNYGDWGKIGTLPDGTQVKFRPSQDGRPTI